MAIYDAFMFFNEFDLLAVRLEEHDPFVDYFILIQADRTHSGEPKELLFSKTDPRFSKYFEKIIVVNANLQESPKSAWDNEELQRKAVFSAAKFDPQDVLYLSDVDEIVSRHHWPYLLKRIEKEMLIGVWLKMYYYFLNLEVLGFPWAMAKIMKAKVFLENNISVNQIRCSPSAVMTPFPCGWHFSYLMTVDQIIEKIKAYGHQENNKIEFTDPKAIQKAIGERKDLFGRDMVFRASSFNSTWPKAMVKSEKWRDFILSVGAKVVLREKGSEILSFGKESLKIIAKPLLARWRKAGGAVESHNAFGSHLFELLISSRPKDQEAKEWRKLIEFFSFILPEIEGRGTARQCAELFLRVISSVKPHSKIVELGSGKGRSSVFASRAAAVTTSRLFCVDLWQEDLDEGQSHSTREQAQSRAVFKEFKKNITLYGCDNVEAYKGKSTEVAAKWAHGPIDFLFIDASQNYESVMEDLKGWIPHLKPGGIVCGDGWNLDECKEVKGSIREAFQDFFKLNLPNRGIVERFWAHQVS